MNETGSAAQRDIVRKLARGSLLSRFKASRQPLKLVAVPRDHVAGDRRRGAALLSGKFAVGSGAISLGDLDFAAIGAEGPLAEQLQGFCWLRDLAAAASRENGARLAEAVIGRWLIAHGAKVTHAQCNRQLPRRQWCRHRCNEPDMLHHLFQKQVGDWAVAVLLEHCVSLEPVPCRVFFAVPEPRRNGRHEASQTGADEDAYRWRGLAGLERILCCQGPKHVAGALGRGMGIPGGRPEKFGDRAGILIT